MTLQIDTIIGNRIPSPELQRILIDLRDTTRAIVDSIQEIRQKAYSEGFNEQQTVLLIKSYLGKEGKTRRQLKWLLYEKPRIKEGKKLTEKLASTGQGTNMSMAEEPETETVNIPTDYNVVVSEQVLEKEAKQLQQEQPESEPVNEALEEQGVKPNYEVENLKLQLKNMKANLDQALTDKKDLEEKYKQLEARRVSPTNNFPALQGNILRIKIVVNPLFREVLQLKGSKAIYANILIDMSQNKYVRLEPL